jgi:hypothetical protein
MWLVLLDSAKDWFLGVDTPGQQVSSRVRYGTTCLLIMIVRYGTTCLLIMIASGIVPCSVVQGRVHGVLINCVVQEEPLWRNLSIARGASMGKP